jgi:hypothetical protein
MKKILLVVLIGIALILAIVFIVIEKSSNCPVIDSTDRFNGSRHYYAPSGKMVLDINNPEINTQIKNQPSYSWNKILNKWCVT